MEKPKHYSKGIDTFKRMESNASREEIKGFIRGNIDKYNWRNKGQDREDFEKIIAYAQWAIELIEEWSHEDYGESSFDKGLIKPKRENDDGWFVVSMSSNKK